MLPAAEPLALPEPENVPLSPEGKRSVEPVLLPAVLPAPDAAPELEVAPLGVCDDEVERSCVAPLELIEPDPLPEPAALPEPDIAPEDVLPSAAREVEDVARSPAPDDV